MTTYFYDSFSGSGTLTGRVPDTNLHPSVAWVNTTAGYLVQSGGWLTTSGGTDATPAIIEKVGIDNTDWGMPGPINVSFTVRTPAVLNGTGGNIIGCKVHIGGVLFHFGLNHVNGNWWLSLLGAPGQIVTGSITTNTVYHLTAVIQSGASSVTITELGITQNSTTAFSSSVGLSTVYASVTETGALGPITITSSGGATPISGPASLTLPKLIASSYGGASASGIALPAVLVRANYKAAAVIPLPSLSAYATAHDSTGERALDATLPSLTVAIRTGANAAVSLPKLSSVATGTVTNLADADLSLPSLTTAASVTVAGMANAAISLPSMSGKSYAGALCSITLGGITTKSTVTAGGVGGAQVTLPLFHATAIATAQNRGSAAIVLPSMQMGATVRAALILPSLQLTVIGTAVVTATYEAYAVNLSHTPRGNEQPNDEATHYTNFPFTHVVRYKNSYYGANSTGLYLLEGTTDAGTPIPWEVKTAITDFKMPNKKTLASAYFSGRFGPASTIKLIEGEKTPNTYSFTTPRGQLAMNHRQKFGKGTKGRYFALAASGTGALELDGIECEVHQLTRRI